MEINGGVGVAAGAVVPGGFWRRFVAVMVDGFIINIITFPIGLVIGLIIAGMGMANPGGEHQMIAIFLQFASLLFTMPIYMFYYAWFYHNRGATPGKMLMGLQVVNSETGVNLTYGKAILRETVGKFCSTIILMIGFIMAGVREDKKALHDLMSSTQVLHKRG